MAEHSTSSVPSNNSAAGIKPKIYNCNFFLNVVKLITKPVTIINRNSVTLNGIINIPNGKTAEVWFTYQTISDLISCTPNLKSIQTSKPKLYYQTPGLYKFTYDIINLKKGSSYRFIANANIKDEKKEKFLIGEPYQNFSTIQAAFDEPFINIISNLIDNDNTYYNEKWGISREQFKIMILGLVWSEANKYGYTAHSGGRTDSFQHENAKKFYFSDGIGPFQIDNGGADRDNWSNWITLEKLNYSHAAQSSLKFIRSKLDKSIPNNLEDMRKVLMETWFGYQLKNTKKGIWEISWAQLTGTQWNIAKTSSKLKPQPPFVVINSNRTWDKLYTTLNIRNENTWEPYDNVVHYLGNKNWDLWADPPDPPIKTLDGKIVEIIGTYPTWKIDARKLTNDFSYYYTFHENPYIEVWLYSNPNPNCEKYNLKAYFIRDYKKKKNTQKPDNEKGGLLTIHSAITDP